MIPWLVDSKDFPPVESALSDPQGLLAAGGSLAPEWLIAAYRRGIFPWYSEGQPILWWSPDPRLILRPAQFHVSRSLRKTLRQQRFDVRFDTAFEAVMTACAQTRESSVGTWITPDMKAAYLRMHHAGLAHSVETWCNGRLVGGVYGIALGRAFFGESMFSHAANASKVALAHLARYLEARNFAVLDCQMTTPHLLSLGAREVPRSRFCAELAVLTSQGDPPGLWPADAGTGFF